MVAVGQQVSVETRADTLYALTAPPMCRVTRPPQPV